MGAPLTEFEAGKLYSNDEIGSSLGVGNARGIRPNLGEGGNVRRLVLMTAIPEARVIAENPYHDRVEGDVLTYTGTGLQGDQEPTGLNGRLAAQLQERFPVWCFRQEFSRRNKAAGKKRWRFLGLLVLLRYHQERQVDVAGAVRTAWVFEFGMATEPEVVMVEDDCVIASEVFAQIGKSNYADLTPVAPELPINDLSEIRVEQLRGRMLALDPRGFELLIKTVFEASGYQDVAVTRYSQDGGIDVNAEFGTFGWPVRACRVQVQAKRWIHTVGRKDVAELRGSLRSDGIGCLISTSHFSKAAVAEAIEVGKCPITLVNGRQLAGKLAALSIDVLGQQYPTVPVAGCT